MAKSKNGGTRAMIRGRVGADVYSIGRDSKGAKQQVVRSLAESVANPQTLNQMRGRMIMATVMQAVAALRPIIDHSFDGFTGKQPNISEFIRVNYALVKADVAAHPASGNKFGLNPYQVKGAKQGCYVISDGKAALPAVLTLAPATGVITIALDSDSMTIAGLKSKLGLTTEEYFTIVGIDANGNALYERFRINPDAADTLAVSSTNVATLFATEGNAAADVAVSGNAITITLDAVKTCCAVIVSRKTTDGYQHNKATLAAGSGFASNANTALPTYPVGSQDFLNGGDSNAIAVNPSEGGESSDEPATENPTLTINRSGSGSAQVSVDGSNVTSGSQVASGKTINITITPASGTTPSATFNGSSVSLTQSGSNYVGSAIMASTNSTLSIDTGSDSGSDPGQE